MLYALMTAEPKPPREVNAEIPPALSNLLMQLLARDRAHRPASAEAVVRALEAIEANTISPEGDPPPAGDRRQGRITGTRTRSLLHLSGRIGRRLTGSRAGRTSPAHRRRVVAAVL